MKSQNSTRRKRALWKGTWTAPTALFLSRRIKLHAPMTTKDRMARMRRAQARPRLVIMALAASE